MWAAGKATRQRACQCPATPPSSTCRSFWALSKMAALLGPHCPWVLLQDWAPAALAFREPPCLAGSAPPGPGPSKRWGTKPSVAAWPGHLWVPGMPGSASGFSNLPRCQPTAPAQFTWSEHGAPTVGSVTLSKISHRLWVWLALSLILRVKGACPVEAHGPRGSRLEGEAGALGSGGHRVTLGVRSSLPREPESAVRSRVTQECRAATPLPSGPPAGHTEAPEEMSGCRVPQA